MLAFVPKMCPGNKVLNTVMQWKRLARNHLTDLLSTQSWPQVVSIVDGDTCEQNNLEYRSMSTCMSFDRKSEILATVVDRVRDVIASYGTDTCMYMCRHGDMMQLYVSMMKSYEVSIYSTQRRIFSQLPYYELLLSASNDPAPTSAFRATATDLTRKPRSKPHRTTWIHLTAFQDTAGVPSRYTSLKPPSTKVQ